jgi:hypothetical protein
MNIKTKAQQKKLENIRGSYAGVGLYRHANKEPKNLVTLPLITIFPKDPYLFSMIWIRISIEILPGSRSLKNKCGYETLLAIPLKTVERHSDSSQVLPPLS